MEENGTSTNEQAISLGDALESGQDVNLDDYDAGSFDFFDDGEGEAQASVAENGADEPAGDDEPGADVTDEPAAEDPAPAEAKDPPADAGIEVVYNGETLHLSAEEAVPYIQKGLNYDRVYERVQAENPYVQAVEQYAQASGMEPEAFLGYIEQGLVQQQADALVANGMPADMALEHARELMQLRSKAQRLDAQQARQTASEQSREQARADFAQLVRKYPDFGREVEAKGFPDELATMIAGGMPPVQAYESWQTKKENESLKQQLAVKTTTDAAKEADTRNRKSAPGSAKGLGDASETSAFSAGFGPPSYF